MKWEEIWTKFIKLRKNFLICLGKLLKAEPSPCETFLFVFLTVAQRFEQIEKFPTLKPKVPVCLWLELCTVILLRRVAVRSNQSSLPKDLRFERGGAKLASCPGCHLTSLRPQ